MFAPRTSLVGHPVTLTHSIPYEWVWSFLRCPGRQRGLKYSWEPSLGRNCFEIMGRAGICTQGSRAKVPDVVLCSGLCPEPSLHCPRSCVCSEGSSALSLPSCACLWFRGQQGHLESAPFGFTSVRGCQIYTFISLYCFREVHYYKQVFISLYFSCPVFCSTRDLN